MSMESIGGGGNSNGADEAEEKGQRLLSTKAPTNPWCSPLLTDLYQFTMAMHTGKRENIGIEQKMQAKLPSNFILKEDEISFLHSIMPTCEDGFFDYLRAIDCSDVEVYSISEVPLCFLSSAYELKGQLL
ncbi:hypothetical protein HPP92_025050 [Vanilla planifolia]|uniref:Uncharacterized protein n=1 Tax=Vanilla planifolia TaxID=51239 RepID=A0A835PHQ9_VANPL|nr:hypothetical protein HPP92_025050 [Vanilla planifolia]